MCVFAEHSKGKHGMLFHHHYLASEYAKHVVSVRDLLTLPVSQSVNVHHKKENEAKGSEAAVAEPKPPPPPPHDKNKLVAL